MAWEEAVQLPSAQARTVTNEEFIPTLSRKQKSQKRREVAAQDIPNVLPPPLVVAIGIPMDIEATATTIHPPQEGCKIQSAHPGDSESPGIAAVSQEPQGDKTPNTNPKDTDSAGTTATATTM